MNTHKRYLLLACGVIYREAYYCAAVSPNIIDVRILDKGLHDIGTVKMRAKLQAELDSVACKDYDAILLAYGLCNNGTTGIHSPLPLVIPRAHDCITLFMGSKEKYSRYFNQNPGVYYETTGWIERGSLVPEGGGIMSQLGITSYDDYVEKYGEDNAQYIMETLGGGMENHYEKYTYIDMHIGDFEDYKQEVKQKAAEKGWSYEEVNGDLGLLKRLIDGNGTRKTFWSSLPAAPLNPAMTPRSSKRFPVINLCIPKTTLRIKTMEFSRLTLGTVQFGINYGIANTSGKPSYETARDIVAAAFDNGISSFDTAAAYGDSEIVLGRIFKDLKLDGKIQVVSKVPGVKEQGLAAAEAEKFIVTSVENSLQRLKLEQLSACLFHREDDLEYIDVLRQLEARGLIAGSGVSADSPARCRQILEKEVKYLQLPYNIIDRRFDDFWPQAEAADITIFTRSVYLQGLLLMPEDQIVPHLKEVIPVRRQLEKLAAEAGIDMPELCIRFVLCNPAVTSVLTGVDSLSQLQQNVELFNKGPLASDLAQKIAEIVPSFPESIVRPALWKK